MSDDFITTAMRVLRERPVDTYSIEHSDHHRRIVVRYGGRRAMVIFPTTSSDRVRGVYNFRAELRRALNGLGVPKPDRTVSPHRPRVRNPAPRAVLPLVEKAPPRSDWRDDLDGLAERLFGGRIRSEA